MKMQTDTQLVYLAGGMNGRPWQDEVMAKCPGLIYLDPRRSGLTSEDGYTRWDLTAVERCDILFAFLERENPSGYGMALEIGFAAALGKSILFVEEPGHPNTRYFGMARAVSDKVVTDLAAGIQALRGWRT